MQRHGDENCENAVVLVETHEMLIALSDVLFYMGQGRPDKRF